MRGGEQNSEEKKREGEWWAVGTAQHSCTSSRHHHSSACSFLAHPVSQSAGQPRSLTHHEALRVAHVLVHAAAVARHSLLRQRSGHVGQGPHHALIHRLPHNLFLQARRGSKQGAASRRQSLWLGRPTAARNSPALHCTANWQPPILSAQGQPPATTPATPHVVNGVLDAVPHAAGQHVDLAGAAVGAVHLHALDDARQEAVGVADAPAVEEQKEEGRKEVGKGRRLLAEACRSPRISTVQQHPRHMHSLQVSLSQAVHHAASLIVVQL